MVTWTGGEVLGEVTPGISLKVGFLVCARARGSAVRTASPTRRARAFRGRAVELGPLRGGLRRGLVVEWRLGSVFIVRGW